MRNENSSSALSRAVANLLRLASSDVKDAELLSAGTNPQNAPLLLHIAVRRTLEAIVATEQGWPVPSRLLSYEKLPDETPLKLELARIARLAPEPQTLALLADGNIAQAFDKDQLHRDVAAIRKLLQVAAERFGVDLLGQGPAKRAVPARPPAPPPPTPKLSKLRAVDALSSDSSPSRSKPPLVPEFKKKEPRPSPISIQDAGPKEPSAEESRVLEGKSPIVPSSRTTITSAMFWKLMERWGVSDLPALNLIGHRGGLSKKGTRPRFKLVGAEAEIVSLLFEIDRAVAQLGLDPKLWANRPIKAAPFDRDTPLSYLTQNGVKGIQNISKYLLRNGLQLSMSEAP